MKPVTVKILEGTINSQKILRIVRWWTMGESLLANKADQGEEQNTEEWASVEESLQELRKAVVTMIKHQYSKSQLEIHKSVSGRWKEWGSSNKQISIEPDGISNVVNLANVPPLNKK